MQRTEQDTVFVGFLGGLIGGLAKLAADVAFFILGIAKTTEAHLAAQAFLPTGTAITLSALALGVAVDLGIAVALGIVAAYIIAFTGRDYLLLKGLIFGALLYVFGYGLVAQAFLPTVVLRPDLATSAVFLLTHLVLGAVTFLVIGQFQTEVCDAQ
ncbi:MAG: hypothetical protein KJ650_02660 [Firmicutes bacterium]|nr:hypothetical protein [Bacillota bacterium]MBV1728093.1 hypothetical protein [Desulforudis sp.]MBU4532531.1 hypothetical protein [Bacillota bacterium]MBU4554546.1 hypothetical protein [Bacillota bacterium]MBV1735102.1 hypothetical protein [Desulforudis sp.]